MALKKYTLNNTVNTQKNKHIAMKKFNLIAASALVALGATAQSGTFSPGSMWNNLPSYSTGSSMIPIDLSEAVSSAQSIYTVSELPSDWAPGMDAQGIKTTKINSLSFPIHMEGGYVVDGEATVKVYLENYEDVTFPLESGKPQWAPYGNGVSATATLSADNAEFAEVWESYSGDYILTVNFDGLEYTGGSLLMTVVCESDLTDGYGMDMYYGGYDYNPDQSVSRTRSASGRTTTLVGKPASTHSTLPIVNFGYEFSYEALPVVGPEKGEPRDVEVGPYANPSTGSETVGDVKPFDARYTYAYTQAVYAPEMLADMVGVEDGGVLTSEIEKLTYKMYFPYGMYSGNMEATVYVQPYDGAALPVVNGKAQWVPVSSDAVSGKISSEEYYYEELYDVPVEFEVTLDKALEYTGGGLLVTWVTESTLEDLYEGYPLSQVFSGNGKVSAIKCAESSLNGLSGDATSAGSELPVLKLHVTPVITRGGETPAIISAATPVLLENGKNNVLAINVEVEDSAADAEYTVQVNGVTAGNTTEKSFTVSYLDVPKKDVLLQLSKVGSSLPATSFTVSVDDFLALFPAITVEAGECALHSEYSIHQDTKATFSAVAEFTVNAGNIKAATIKSTPKDNQCRVVASNTNMPDSFDSFLPTGTYNDYAATGGRICFYHPSFTTAPVTYGVAELPAAKKMEVAFSMLYPIAYKAVPSLKEDNATLLTTGVTVDYENGSQWSFDKGICSNVVTATEANTTFDPTYPFKLEMRVDKNDGVVVFFAPENHTIHFAFFPDEAPMRAAAADIPEGIEWTNSESGIWKTELSAGQLHVKTVNNATGEDAHYLSYAVDGNGELTGIEMVSVDGQAPAVIYNLQGVAVGTELNKLPAGVYIQGGVKILKK